MTLRLHYKQIQENYSNTLPFYEGNLERSFKIIREEEIIIELISDFSVLYFQIDVLIH